MVSATGVLAYEILLEMFLAGALLWSVAVVSLRFFRDGTFRWQSRLFFIALLVPIPSVLVIHLLIRPFLGLPEAPLESLLQSIIGLAPWLGPVFLAASGLLAGYGAFQGLRPLASFSYYRNAWRRQPRNAAWRRCRRALKTLESRMGTPHTKLVLTEGGRCGSLSAWPFGAFVVIPAALADELDAGELDSLLAHELAHIKRHDSVTGILASIGLYALIFTPFTHLSYRGYIRSREEVIDRMAASATGDPLALASCLVKASRFFQGFYHSAYLPSAELLPSRNALRQRVQLLLDFDNHASPAPRSLGWMVTGLFTAAFFILLLTM